MCMEQEVLNAHVILLTSFEHTAHLSQCHPHPEPSNRHD